MLFLRRAASIRSASDAASPATSSNLFRVSQHLDSFLFAIHMSNRAHLGS